MDIEMVFNYKMGLLPILLFCQQIKKLNHVTLRLNSFLHLIVFQCVHDLVVHSISLNASSTIRDENLFVLWDEGGKFGYLTLSKDDSGNI